MKKLKKYLTYLLVLLVCIYLGYQLFFLTYYSYTIRSKIAGVSILTSKEMHKRVNINHTITLKHQDLAEEEYLQVQNIKIKNDFQNFKFINSGTKEKYSKYILFEGDERKDTAFFIGEGDSYIKKLITDFSLFYSDSATKMMSSKMISSILKENHIHNDVELMKYLYKKFDKSNNMLFTPVNDMKYNYHIKRLASILFDYPIQFIAGDYQGYILSLKNELKVVRLLQDDKIYSFVFYNDDYFTEEYIMQLLKTVVIVSE